MKQILSVILSLTFILSPLSYGQDGGDPSEQHNYHGGQGGYDFYSKQVLILATSMIGSSIISQCSQGLKVPSIAAFMGGSVVHILAEIAGAKDTMERHKRKLSEIKIDEARLAKKGGEFQLESLKKMKKDEEESLDYIKKRKSWVIAVNVIYLAAAALAVLEEVYGFSAAVAKGLQSCTSLASSCTYGYAGCLAACTALAQTSHVTAKGSFLSDNSKSIGQSTCVGPYASACIDANDSYHNLAYGHCKNSSPAKALSWSTAFQLAWGFGVGQMDGGDISKYGKYVLSLLKFLVPSVGSSVVKAYNYPIPRSVTFGVATGLATAITLGLEERQRAAEENIQKLNRVIANFKIVTDNSTGGVGEGGEDNSGVNPITPVPMVDKPITGQINRLANLPSQKSCTSDTGSAFEQGSGSCAKPLKLTIPQFQMHDSMSALNKVANLGAEMGNAMSSGDMDKASLLAGEIASYAAQVKSINEQLQAKYNERETKAGRSSLDFKKAIAAEVAGLQKQLEDSAVKGEINLAALGSSTPSTATTKATTSDASSGSPIAVVPLAPPSVDVSVDGGSEETIPVTALDSEQALGPFEMPVDDVQKQSEVSIFKLLSNRYILSYPKVLRPKSIEPSEPEPLKKVK